MYVSERVRARFRVAPQRSLSRAGHGPGCGDAGSAVPQGDRAAFRHNGGRSRAHRARGPRRQLATALKEGNNATHIFCNVAAALITSRPMSDVGSVPKAEFQTETLPVFRPL